jgi:hypothetical protein
LCLQLLAILMVMILIFMVLVVAISNPPGHDFDIRGLGCSY